MNPLDFTERWSLNKPISSNLPSQGETVGYWKLIERKEWHYTMYKYGTIPKPNGAAFTEAEITSIQQEIDPNF